MISTSLIAHLIPTNFQEAESKNEEATASNVSKSGKKNVKAVDLDPHGDKLLQVIFVENKFMLYAL